MLQSMGSQRVRHDLASKQQLNPVTRVLLRERLEADRKSGGRVWGDGSRQLRMTENRQQLDEAKADPLGLWR